MPHPRINPALVGEYVRIGDYPGAVLPRGVDRQGWIKVDEIQRVVKAAGELRFVFKDARPQHVHRGPHLALVEQKLRAKGVTFQ